MPQQIAMEGDDVTPEELQGNGWFSVLKRRQESRAKSHAARQSGTQRGATATPNATLRRVAAASRLPAMPRSHNQIIVRPGGGLNVQACSPHRILAALTMAAQLAPSTAADTVCRAWLETRYADRCSERPRNYSSSSSRPVRHVTSLEDTLVAVLKRREVLLGT
ncbi:hypothetical protein MRX96_003627 [Rhipicephalus microplus]